MEVIEGVDVFWNDIDVRPAPSLFVARRAQHFCNTCGEQRELLYGTVSFQAYYFLLYGYASRYLMLKIMSLIFR